MCARADLEDVTLYHLHTEGHCAFADRRARGPLPLGVALHRARAARRRSPRGAPTSCRSSSRTSPTLFLSRPDPARRRARAALAAESSRPLHARAPRSTPRWRRSTRRARCSPRSTSGCRARSATRSCRCRASRPSRTPIGRSSSTRRRRRRAVEARIGELVADLVEDGSSLQMGIGAIPDAVLARLGNKHDLGVHTEMFSDGLIPLVESGVVTNAKKKVHAGRTVTSFVSGTRKVFDFVDDNPMVELHPCDRTNDTALIAKNDRVVAINSAIEIDLTGQVCADSIGHRIYSGIGGQMDFIRGAARSRGGKPIIALPSTAARRQALAHRPRAQGGRRRRHHARPRALGRHRVRRGQPARQDAARARRGAHLDRAPRLPRGSAARPPRGSPLRHGRAVGAT